MKVYVLTWNEYIIGVFPLKRKAEKAVKYYEAMPKLGNEADYPFNIQTINYDTFSEEMLEEIEEDGWFEEDDLVEEEEVKSKKPVGFLLPIILLLLAITCLITGFVTIIKFIF